MTYPKHILEKKGDSVVGHMKHGTNNDKENKVETQVAFISVDQGVGEVPPPFILFIPAEERCIREVLKKMEFAKCPTPTP